MGNSQTTPRDAYRFARGERINLPPFNPQGVSLRYAQLNRPLDFSIVTDHAENMGMVRVCADTALEGYGSWSCGRNHLLVEAMRRVSNWLPGVEPFCGEGTESCQGAAQDVWRDTITAAQNFLDECEFTTFVGYEWSGSLDGANMHRNVIFNKGKVPDNPISSIDAPFVEELWNELDRLCNDLTDCEAITIPHNPNLSKGRMFSSKMSDGSPMTASVAEQRSRYDRLVEIVQHKGDSECHFAADELCTFEKLPYSSFMGKYVEWFREPPANDSRYLREALREGFRLERNLGLNPFTPGYIGSTDTHISASGAVEEGQYKGNHGAQHISGDGARAQLPDRVEQNPGGLAVLYAEQNTREALFAAMRRREAYGTSGPRIGLRFFGGRSYSEDLCGQTDLIEQGYKYGSPMGGLLEEGSRAPSFIVWAAQDEGTEALPGTPLQRIQIIKGWIAQSGESQERVYEVAGDPDNGADVDLDSCKPRGAGFAELCTVWTDPEFDPALSAYYYARVVENPSCRWQQHICAANGISCKNADELPPEFAGCCDDTVSKTLQERAWSSPIWHRGERM